MDDQRTDRESGVTPDKRQKWHIEIMLLTTATAALGALAGLRLPRGGYGLPCGTVGIADLDGNSRD